MKKQGFRQWGCEKVPGIVAFNDNVYIPGMEKPLKNSIVKRHRAPARHWQAETQFRLQLACAAMTGQKRPKRSFGMAPASEEALWIAQYVQILDGRLNEAARASGLSPSTLRNYGIYSPRRFGQEPVAPERIQAFDQAIPAAFELALHNERRRFAFF